MKPYRQLSRLIITGHIYEHTPICVLMEIADAHGIKFDQKDYEKPNFAQHLLASIYQSAVPTIPTGEITELSHWQFVARFVNKHSEWPQAKLTQSYNFLLDFMNGGDPLTKIPDVFTVGLQTPKNPLSINACILYKTCMYHRLTVNSHTTITQMECAVKMLRESIESVMRRAVTFVERDAKRIDLINVIMLSPYEIQDPGPIIIDDCINFQEIPKINAGYDLMVRLHESLSDIKTLRGRLDPYTDAGAIALSALNFNIDISKTVSPTREYKNLRICGRNDYRPVDSWMNYWYNRNPIMFDLTVTFNPLFPVEFYETNRLTSMVHNEGYTSAEISEGSPYELLQLAYVSETFYQGEMPNLKSMETPIELDDIKSVPNGELLCYGNPESPLRIISMYELIQLFDINQNFSTPFGSESVFPQTAINKLKLIAQSPSGPNPSIRLTHDSLKIRQRLVESIEAVELILSDNDVPSRQLVSTYRNSNPDIKQAIVTTLTNLLHLGMYMRGWCGSGDYPIHRADVPTSRDLEVAINVTESIVKYEASCRSLGKIGNQINNLPLVIYKDSEYQVSTEQHDGITISERIEIIKGGDTISNISSCIRLSSNWICSSAHRYITIIGQPSPFDVFYLRHIS